MKKNIPQKPYVVYWNNIPSPYMVERFNALADRKSFEFEAWFNDRIETGRSWEVDESRWRFRYRYMPTTRLGGRKFHWPLPLFGRWPDLLISLYAEPSFLAGWALAKLRGAKTGFWVVLTFDRWVARKPFKEAMKRWLLPKTDAIVTTGEDGKRFVERYGTSSEKIFFAPHVIDVAHYQVRTDKARSNREVLRRQHGIEGTTFIYVGRLWWGKGINCLLEAFEAVQRQSAKPVSLLLVGDGPEEARLKRTCAKRNIRNVVFAGFQQKPNLPRYYAVADVFVFPTLGDPYGLVVDEAMACSLPVISTSAAGEIRDRVEERVNGYIVPPENSILLSDRMSQFVHNPELCDRMGKISYEKIKDHTPARWAEDFERIVDCILKKTGNST